MSIRWMLVIVIFNVIAELMPSVIATAATITVLSLVCFEVPSLYGNTSAILMFETTLS